MINNVDQIKVKVNTVRTGLIRQHSRTMSDHWWYLIRLSIPQTVVQVVLHVINICCVFQLREKVETMTNYYTYVLALMLEKRKHIEVIYKLCCCY